MPFERTPPLRRFASIAALREHTPSRGTYVVQGKTGDLYNVTREEGDFLVTYHNAPCKPSVNGDAVILDLASPVMATWERIRGTDALDRYSAQQVSASPQG